MILKIIAEPVPDLV